MIRHLLGLEVRLIACFLKIGARVVIGPGQSAGFSYGEVYTQSEMNQVYVPNDSRINQIFVDNCTEAECPDTI